MQWYEHGTTVSRPPVRVLPMSDLFAQTQGGKQEWNNYPFAAATMR